MERHYYSQRHGQRATVVSLAQLKRILGALYRDWEIAGLLQEWFGYDCVDDGKVPGRAGSDPVAFAFRKTLNEKLWPIDNTEAWTEGDVFDAIEFLHDHASNGVEGRYHSYGGCGQHYSTLNAGAGRARVRADLNPLLARYGSGYELMPDGDVVDLLRREVIDLVRTEVPAGVPDVVARHLSSAIRLFRRRGTSTEDRRNAVRELADSFEYLRDQLKPHLFTGDDAMLFELANRFHLRHSNPSQLRNYDPSWLRWMFEIYLSTLFHGFHLLGWDAAVTEDDPPIPDEPTGDRVFDPDEIPF